MRSVRLSCVLALLLTGCPDLPDEQGSEVTGGIDGEQGPVDEISQEALRELPPCSFSILNAFSEDEVQPPGEASGGWMAPEDDTLAAIGASFEALLNIDPGVALGQTAVVGYTMCRGSGEEGQMVLWRPAWPGTGRALFAWRIGAVNDLIIEAPHAWASPATMEQAIATFQATGARALIAGGSHPCSNIDAVGCGSDSVCGTDTALASDVARNDATVFQLAHRLLADRYPSAWVVSLQPMDDSGVSVSNGTLGEAITGGAAEAVGLALADALPDQLVTSCNPYEGAVVEARYCGVDSVQARYINGAADVCTDDSAPSSGRYVQLSQSPEVQAHVLTVADAIATAVSTQLAD